MIENWPEGLKEFVERHHVEVRQYDDGERLILYKAVRRSFRPWSDDFQPKRGYRPYAPGILVRSALDDDRDKSCASGIHLTTAAGSLAWLKENVMGRADIVIELAVRPKHVVVPKDSLYIHWDKLWRKVRTQEALVLRMVPIGEVRQMAQAEDA